MIRIRLSALALCSLVTAAALSCGGGDGGGAVTDPKPVPGTLTATLTTPNPDDRGLLLTISGGPITSVSASGTYVAFSQISANGATGAVFGNLVNGAIVRLAIPDVAAASSYAATVTEAVDAANVPRESLAGYAVAIAR